LVLTEICKGGIERESMFRGGGGGGSFSGGGGGFYLDSFIFKARRTV